MKLLYMSINKQDKNGNTPLIKALLDEDETLANQLVQHDDLDPNIQNNDGESALFLAVYNGFTSVVQKLLRNKKTNVNIQDDTFKRTPLHAAVNSRHIEIVEMLLNDPRVEVDVEDADGMTPLIIGARHPKNGLKYMDMLLKTMKVDFNKKSITNRSVLLDAAADYRWYLVKRLMKEDGIDLNIQDKEGNTALFYAVESKDDKMVYELLINKKDKIDTNIQNNDGNTALIYAAGLGLTKIACMLLTCSRTNPNIQNNDKQTALHYAVFNDNDDIVYHLLMNKKTKMDLRDSEGKTPKDLARELKKHRILSMLM